jgi:hypothetical protein
VAIGLAGLVAWTVPLSSVVLVWPVLFVVPGWIVVRRVAPDLSPPGSVGVAIVTSTYVSAHLVDVVALTGHAPTELDVKTVEVTLVSPIPTISSIVPTSSYVVLGSGYTSYTTTIQNPGPARSTVLVQGWISQGTARRAAGGSNVNCAGFPYGTLPTGTCSTLADMVASNDPIIVGTGTLVPGPATFELELKQYDGTTTTILDTESIPITLVASTPSIVSIDFTSTTIAIGGQSRYTATLYNPTSSTLTGTLIQGTITQGANSAPAGGVVTSCPSTSQVAPGSCAVTFTANPSNANSSPGPLVPGAATFELRFYQNGTVLDTKSVAITLTSP